MSSKSDLSLFNYSHWKIYKSSLDKRDPVCHYKKCPINALLNADAGDWIRIDFTKKQMGKKKKLSNEVLQNKLKAPFIIKCFPSSNLYQWFIGNTSITNWDYFDQYKKSNFLILCLHFYFIE